MSSPHPRVFTIPASAPFLATLITHLVQGAIVPGVTGVDPLLLASGTIYLPTRRACRLARDRFLDALGTQGALLPRLIPLGDVDEDEFAFAETPTEAALQIPETIGRLERRLLLTKLVLDWANRPRPIEADRASLVANTPGAALALADALARLIDDMTTRNVSWDRLDDLVADDLDEYWQLTLNVLKLARNEWPALLATRGAIEPALRRDRMIAAEAERLKRGTGGFIVAAGSTASMPSTAVLLATIAALPNGAVVLPGLDTDLDDASWNLLGEAAGVSPVAVHPQYSMHRFLRDMGVARSEVGVLGARAAAGRETLVSEVLRPAASTDQWAQLRLKSKIPMALAQIAMIEAANPEEEALAIAVALREAAEQPNRRAALVTPDRALARRVAVALGRWGIIPNDSGGDPLSMTPAGVFARLIADAATGGLAPVTLLALLKHPMLRLGRSRGAWTYGVGILERAILRGPRPLSGTAALLRAINTVQRTRDDLHGSDARRRLTDGDFDVAKKVTQGLAAALSPIEALSNGSHPLADIAAAHQNAMIALAVDQNNMADAFAGDDGEALADVFSNLTTNPSAGDLRLEVRHYPEFFAAALADQVVRRAENASARISIFGLLEARLQSVDRIVLGALVEGTWPPQNRADPWLSRPMREQLGLDLPERRIGLTAHDFAQALGVADVIMSRAAKIGGTPTVASRFVQRLAAVAGEQQWQAVLQRGAQYVRLARKLDESLQPRLLPRPQPCPPVAARPQRLSVTDIEHLLRDPYTIYAKHVLRLRKLDRVDCPPGAGDRGSAIHDAIGDFTKLYPDALPVDAYAELLRLGRARFTPLADYPEAQAFWWPRFERVAQWFVAWEGERRAAGPKIYTEIEGVLDLQGLPQPFKLTVRADRIERFVDGTYSILDYKTGRPPTTPQVRSGLAPQLTLEGAILRRGGFGDIPPDGTIAEFIYVRLHGGEPAGEHKPIDLGNTSADAEADRALEKLTDVIARFQEQATPYLPMVRPMFRTFYGDYDHLERIREWSLTGGDVEEGAEP
jgi:ATP-dependent helicase/nuclease subunit B